ncbi:Aldo/keto reductase [Tothia fuscella]|uniref:Aldo/keto reductase n=1 Tax=Tothia fuscella TaxID=1048955 RepID=A0A9P4TWK1_9PEZI|nr:Aldo/keto reductase [Tothia fuscella]
MSEVKIPTLSLNDGNSIPRIGFGTGTVLSDRRERDSVNRTLVDTIKNAISSGLRHIDGAESYGNEGEFGVAVKESGLPRDQFFVTTKVKNIGELPGAIDGSLKRLDMDYVDLYLIHHPYGAADSAELQTAWKAMESIKSSGKAKSIGVSNYLRKHMDTILEIATIVPAINQIEFHPYLQREPGYISWLQEKGIVVTSYGGLTPLVKGKGGPLDGPIANIAAQHGISENAVLIQWQIQQNVVPITTSTKAGRLVEYLSAFKLELDPKEIEEITNIGRTHHLRAFIVDRFDKGDRS